MVIAKPMDHDDDVEHLFSWLQTPELRYREFAGAREITDTVIIRQERPDNAEIAPAPRHNTQLEEEYPADQFPDQRDAPEDIVVQNPAAVAPTTGAAAAPGPAAYNAGLFALGSGGRGTPRHPHYEEPVAPSLVNQPRVIQPPEQQQVTSSVASSTVTPSTPPVSTPPVATPVSASAPLSPAPQPAAVPNRGGLLGGTYRQNEFNDHNGDTAAADQPAAGSRQRGEGSLDAVFGRLSEARNRLPDPRDRMRPVSGLNSPANRQR
jgi:hypothetical protein